MFKVENRNGYSGKYLGRLKPLEFRFELLTLTGHSSAKFGIHFPLEKKILLYILMKSV